MAQSDKSTAFSKRLWSWFDVHKRALPWRDLNIADDTERAYQILVSEVMLQQTQVSRVQIIFKAFIERFGTIKKLAQASNAEVILAWRGMGYNSRALRLRDAAKTIVVDYQSEFPKDLQQLKAIKGIGPYTAAAIRNFAFNLPTVCIDTNIRRILHRIFFGPENIYGNFSVPDRDLELIAGSVLKIALETPLPRSGGGAGGGGWHAALMDFGSMVCTKRSPTCDICPMAKNNLCASAFKVPTFQRDITKKQEPGRMTSGRHIPNRIFRGRIVEALRDAKEGLVIDEIGPIIAIDWNTPKDHEWLLMILERLIKDRMIVLKDAVYVLSE